MEYIVEYHTTGYGTHLRKGTDLASILLTIQSEGCRITHRSICNALEWSKTAKNGNRHFIGCVCTITKGERQMTAYTSF